MKQNENYEKKYKEALDRASHIQDYNTIGTPREIAELIFPELQESEDEKMIGTIRLALTDVPEERFTTEGTSLSKVYAWIDKKKEQMLKDEAEKFFDSADSYNQGFIAGQKKMKDDIEKGFGISEHSLDYLAGRYAGYAAAKKEQKPIEFDEYKIIKKHITEDMLSSEVNKRLTECGWYVTDEKPVEWSEENEKDMAYIIRILDDCYAYGKHDLSKTDHENLVSKLKSLHPQPKNEWSEEDEDMLNRCISSIDEAKENRYYYKETDGDTSYDEEIKWLKSLHPQSKQEWSEDFEEIKPEAFKASMEKIWDFLKRFKEYKEHKNK